MRLAGLSPKENRDVPPLDYALVGRVKQDRPGLDIILNGGIGREDAMPTLKRRQGWYDPSVIEALEKILPKEVFPATTSPSFSMAAGSLA